VFKNGVGSERSQHSSIAFEVAGGVSLTALRSLERRMVEQILAYQEQQEKQSGQVQT